MADEPIIIGTHGLANKPAKDELANWWRASIAEGLTKKEQAPGSEFRFEMVYWASRLYRNHLHNDAEFHFDQLCNREPYREAFDGTLKSKKDGLIDELSAAALGGETVDFLEERFGVNSLADAVLGNCSMISAIIMRMMIRERSHETT